MPEAFATLTARSLLKYALQLNLEKMLLKLLSILISNAATTSRIVILRWRVSDKG